MRLIGETKGTTMTPLSKAAQLLVVAAALTSSASQVFARGGGGAATHPVTTTSTKSTTPTGTGSGANNARTIQSKAKACRYHHCVTVPRQGTTPAGGNGGPDHGGVDNPALHPK
jgi:hypothetical protein